jgi:hypothetical protein
MDAQLNANSRNGVQNRIITGEINDIKDDISTISTHLSNAPSKTIITGTLGAVGVGVSINYPTGYTSTNCYGVLTVAAIDGADPTIYVDCPRFGGVDSADYALFADHIAVTCRSAGYANRVFRLMLIK